MSELERICTRVKEVIYPSINTLFGLINPAKMFQNEAIAKISPAKYFILVEIAKINPSKSVKFCRSIAIISSANINPANINPNMVVGGEIN